MIPEERNSERRTRVELADIRIAVGTNAGLSDVELSIGLLRECLQIKYLQEVDGEAMLPIGHALCAFRLLHLSRFR